MGTVRAYLNRDGLVYVVKGYTAADFMGVVSTLLCANEHEVGRIVVLSDLSVREIGEVEKQLGLLARGVVLIGGLAQRDLTEVIVTIQTSLFNLEQFLFNNPNSVSSAQLAQYGRR